MVALASWWLCKPTRKLEVSKELELEVRHLSKELPFYKWAIFCEDYKETDLLKENGVSLPQLQR